MLTIIATYLNIPSPIKPLAVKTGSMEPAISAGSLVFVSKKSEAETYTYIEDDVITFKQNGELVSHRITRVIREDNEKFFETRGDANNAVDQTLVAEKDVVGKVVFDLPFLGRVTDFVRQPVGFAFLIIIPTLLLIISEVFSIFEELRKQRIEKEKNNFPKPVILVFVASLFITGSYALFSDTGNVNGISLSTAEAFCDAGPTWLSSVTANNQGTRKDGSAILPGRTDPNLVFGANNWVVGGSSGFFSLGFTGGNATWAFPHQVLNVNASLTFYEATNGRNSYPLETADVFVSQDNSTYALLGQISSEPSGDGVVTLNLGSVGLSSIKYVRLVETSNIAIHTSDADGLDIDAVKAEFGNCSNEE